MRLFVGLGNPGSRHARNRHNIGFMAVDEIARAHRAPPWRRRFQGEATEALVGGERILCLKPQTYMNESGRAVGPARGALRVELDHVLVLHDEIDLPFGDVRTRVGGGLAGHNGLRSLRRELGDPGFARVRIGVGRPDSTDPEVVSAHVLGRWRRPRPEVEALVAAAADAAERLVVPSGG